MAGRRGHFPKWRCPRRVKQFAGLHLRQLPCVSAIAAALPNWMRCWKRRNYATLGQDEADDGTESEDKRQRINEILGSILMKVALIIMIVLAVLLFFGPVGKNADEHGQDWSLQEFRRDSPIILHVGALELFVCGACAQAAAVMYKRRRHALRHPKDFRDPAKAGYVRVELRKQADQEARQLYGVGFRRSTDGMECLVVEDVRRGSAVEAWNQEAVRPNPVDVVEEALRDDGDLGNSSGRFGEYSLGVASSGLSLGSGEAEGRDPQVARDDEEAATGRDAIGPSLSSDRAEDSAAPFQVLPGASIVAVNDTNADIGLMQKELMKPNVAIWVRVDVDHPSTFESDVFSTAEPDSTDDIDEGESVDKEGAIDGNAPEPMPIGQRAGADGTASLWSTVASSRAVTNLGPPCACVAVEDEEPQVLHRWLVCSILFGWVTLVPILLMHPHEERPRQRLFREILLWPCFVLLPVWLALWVLDCVEVCIPFKILSPFAYFVIVHMVLPIPLVYYILKLQVEDEKIVFQQRKTRQAELEKECISPPIALEDPSPTFLRELICVNPIAMVWLACAASVPIVLCTLCTTLESKRATRAKWYVASIYGPMIPLQGITCYILWYSTFVELPALYLMCFSLLVSIPCCLVWCVCLLCSARYAQGDMQIVRDQRSERATAAMASRDPPEMAVAAGNQPKAARDGELVDCTETLYREWELIYTA